MTNMRRLAFLTLTIVWTASTVLAQPAPRRLLELASGQSAPSRGPRVAETRRGFGRVDTQALSFDRLELTPFADVRVVARRTSRSHPRTGSTIWHGKLEAPDHGEVTLAMVNGVLAGTLTVDGRQFEIGFAGGGLHEIREMNPSLFPTDDPPLDLISSSGSATVSSPTSSALTSGGQIDVMVVWTPAARNAVGGTAAAIQSVVDLAIAHANAAYANSQIATSLRLVYGGEVTFAETPSNINGDLVKLASGNDGQLDQVHTLRNQYAADIVTLIGSGYASAGYCGMGYLMSSVSTSFASNAFNVVDQTCAAGNLSYAHEVGHNQGLHHDPPNAGGSPSYPYAYGFQDPTGAFRTVMSYGGAPRIQRFSSPNVFYNGRVTGTSSQDNARALNNTAATVANFRTSASTTCSYTLTPTAMTFSETGGTAAVDVTTTAGCSWTTASGSSWVSVGPGGSGSGSVVVNVAPNTGSQRSTSITVAGRAISISEAAAPTSCSYSVSPTSLGFTALGGSATVNVTTSTGCSWTTGSGLGWATVTAGGTGSGPVTVTTSANGGASRAGTVTVAGQAVSLTQAAATSSCSYTVSPLSLSLPASGGVAQVVVTTAAGCGWTARTNTGWLKVSGSGSGSGVATLRVGGHSGAQRTATAIVAGQTVTVTQLAGRKR